MSQQGLVRHVTSRLTICSLAVIFLASATFAVFGATEAIEEHSAASDVTDLRFAVLSVLEIDENSEVTSDEAERLEANIATLSRDIGPALHAIEDNREAFVTTELDMVLSHARALRDGTFSNDMIHDVAAHADLEDILRQASLRATANAATNERTTRTATIVSLGMLLLLTTSLMTSRAQQTQRTARTDAFRAAALRLGALLDESPDATAVVSDDGNFSYRSASFDRLFRHQELRDIDSLVALIDDKDARELKQRVRAFGTTADTFDISTTELDQRSGPREFSVRVADLRTDPLVEGHMVTLRETTDENKARRELEALTVTDQLTGLPNRRALMQGLDTSESTTTTLLMIDLDDFKRTNDTHGHDAGDELLRAVAKRFGACCTNGETLHRLGGDEFAILADSDNLNSLLELGERLLRSLDDPIALSSGFEEARASIGLAIWDGSGPRAALLRRSDIALYSAKSNGGNRVEALRPELEGRSVRQRSISSLLHAANLDDEFSLVFQPIVEAKTGEVAFVEALIRWHSPSLGPVYPDEFIPMAESSGRIVEIGLWVLRRAVQELAAWREAGADPSISVSVNVAPRQLEEPGFVDEALHLLRTYGVEPEGLVVEVTESALVKPGNQMVKRLEQLRSAGCHIACDDFGSGYSNLGQLLALPLDLIKIDRELLLHLSEMRAAAGGDNRGACEVMNAVARIGAVMRSRIVAEGVETEVQRASLQASDVDYLQGYYFSRPVTSDDMLRMLVSSQLLGAPRRDCSKKLSIK